MVRIHVYNFYISKEVVIWQRRKAKQERRL